MIKYHPSSTTGLFETPDSSERYFKNASRSSTFAFALAFDSGTPRLDPSYPRWLYATKRTSSGTCLTRFEKVSADQKNAHRRNRIKMTDQKARKQRRKRTRVEADSMYSDNRQPWHISLRFTGRQSNGPAVEVA